MPNENRIFETLPSARLAGLLDQAAGPGKRYAGLDDGETVAAAGRWDALGSWATAQMLAAIRELIRRNPATGHETKSGRLPGAWRRDLTEEIALQLGVTKTAADALINLAWTLEKRLPLTAAALDDGTLNLGKTRMMADETSVLSDADAGRAEELVAGQWEGKTWSQIRRKIALAVVNVDPEGAAKRRERAEREDARVRFWREHSGAAGLAGYALPTDRALRAHAAIQARARAYRAWGIPGTLDQLRVLAYLDKLLDTDARDQYPRDGGQDPASDSKAGASDADADADARDADADARDTDTDTDTDARDTDAALCDDGDAGDACDTRTAENGDGEDSEDGEDGDDGQDGEGPADGGGSRGPGDGPAGHGGPRGPAGADDGLPANVQLAVPMLGLLGLAERAGEAHGLGVLDPDLGRRLAADAARNPRSNIEIIVTDSQGRAIGFGKATPARKPKAGKPPKPEQSARTRAGAGTSAAFTPAGPGPPGGYGTWTLAIGDDVFTVKLAPIPGGECDHRYESAGYQPSETLRRLVRIRDGECAMPVCVRHPRGCDWEHAIPWPEGRTCACNGGYHCRRDHLIKQSKSWKIEQLTGGRRRWTTPSGRTYTSQPYQYPI